MFGFVAMLLWTAYVVSTRHFRRQMDVATFMATVSPIAAVAVLPLAIANGDVFGMSGTGWTYMLILTFLSGVAAHGLMVFAQKTIPIGTIGIAQVAQPALAVVWSFLLLGERVGGRQVVGIAVVMGGLLGVPGASTSATSGPSAGSGVRLRRARRTACASPRSSSVMKCEASSMRPSACAHSDARPGEVAGFGSETGERVQREHLDVRRADAAASPRIAVSRLRHRRPAVASRAASRHSPRAACSPPPALRCHADACSRTVRAPTVSPWARRMRPRWTRTRAASRTSPTASALPIASSSVAAPLA